MKVGFVIVLFVTGHQRLAYMIVYQLALSCGRCAFSLCPPFVMAMCAACFKLQKQMGEMWKKMTCLEMDLQASFRRAACMQQDIKFLKIENEMLRKKCEQAVAEGSDADSSSEEEAAGPTPEQLQRGENIQLRAEILELRRLAEVKGTKRKLVSQKVVLYAPTEAMKLQDPEAADEIEKLHHFRKLLKKNSESY